MPKKRTFQSLRGMRDILPQDDLLWKHVNTTAEDAAFSYGFTKMETPILEDTELFRRSVGEGTDIVNKEMFSFKDHGGDDIALRPEFTASIARSFIEHGLMNQPKPLKVFEIGQCFRYERPQSGRLRQFHQFNAEIIGLSEAVADAEAIALAHSILTRLGLEAVVQVNSIGDVDTRKRYVKQLRNYFQQKLRYLTKEDQDHFKSNPMRLLDSKNKRCAEFSAEAPQIVDFLDEESKNHLMKVLECLDGFDLPYELNPRIVRGLDYYTRTAFEFWIKEEGASSFALGGGGRYDGLIEMLGGRETPALGFALGLERIISKMREKNIMPPSAPRPEIFLAHLGEESRAFVFKLFHQLQDKGYACVWNLSRSSLKQQLESANKLKALLTIIVGEKEAADKEILLKEMDTGAQENVPMARLDKELIKRLRQV